MKTETRRCLFPLDFASIYFFTRKYTNNHTNLFTCNSNASQHIQVTFLMYLNYYYYSQANVLAPPNKVTDVSFYTIVSFHSSFLYSLWEVRWFHVWELNFFIFIFATPLIITTKIFFRIHYGVSYDYFVFLRTHQHLPNVFIIGFRLKCNGKV